MFVAGSPACTCLELVVNCKAKELGDLGKC